MKKIKRHKIRILLAACVVCIVLVVLNNGRKETFNYEEMTSLDSFVARYTYENIDEEGTLFSYYKPIELKMQVGLWYKEGRQGKQKPFIQISWENEKGIWKEKVKKFYLDEPYYREGVYDEEQGVPELEPVDIHFFVNKNMIAEKGTFSVTFIADTKPYEIWFNEQTPPDIMILRYEKQEDGILVYAEKKLVNFNESSTEDVIPETE